MLEKAARLSLLSERMRTRKACGVASPSKVLHTRRQERRTRYSQESKNLSKIKSIISRGTTQEDREAIHANVEVKVGRRKSLTCHDTHDGLLRKFPPFLFYRALLDAQFGCSTPNLVPSICVCTCPHFLVLQL